MAINRPNPYSLALAGQNLGNPFANTELLKALADRGAPMPLPSGGRRTPSPAPAPTPTTPDGPGGPAAPAATPAAPPPQRFVDPRNYSAQVAAAQIRYNEAAKAGDEALSTGQISQLQRRRIDERYRNELGYLAAKKRQLERRDANINAARQRNADRKAKVPTSATSTTTSVGDTQSTQTDKTVKSLEEVSAPPTGRSAQMDELLRRTGTGFLMDLATPRPEYPRSEYMTLEERMRGLETAQMPREPAPPAPFDPSTARQFSDQEMADFARRYLVGTADASTARSELGRMSVGNYLNDLLETTTGYRPLPENFGRVDNLGMRDGAGTGLYDPLVDPYDNPLYPSRTEANIDESIRQGPINSMNPVAREALKERLGFITRELYADLPHEGRPGFPSEAAIYEDRLRRLISAVGPGFEQNILKLIVGGANPNALVDPRVAELGRGATGERRTQLLNEMSSDPMFLNPNGRVAGPGMTPEDIARIPGDVIREERRRRLGYDNPGDPRGASLMMPGTEIRTLDPVSGLLTQGVDPNIYYSPETMAVRPNLPSVISPQQAAQWMPREIADANQRVAADEATSRYGTPVNRASVEATELDAANRQIDLQEAARGARATYDSMRRPIPPANDVTGPLGDLARIRRLRAIEQAYGPRPVDIGGEMGPVRPPVPPFYMGGYQVTPF